MSEERIYEICKAFASGMTAAQIADVEGLPAAQVELIINDNPGKVAEIKVFMEEMGWAE